ncbi:MAG: hypothetical protein CMJ83_19850 [Planctomycetes bacterium]|nr:hypothetical protein [Planctomycetota bacterium]
MKPGVLVTKPRLKEVVWGGDRLQTGWNKSAPERVKIGESWEISCVDGWESGVAGESATLQELYDRDPAWFRGEEAPRGRFPLLVKLIATRQLLSVQVHPNDEQARARGGTAGKHEAWLVLEADADAYLYLGVREGVDADRFEAATLARDPDAVHRVMHRVVPRPGEVFDVPPGTMHALGPGLVLLEVQQPSDLTYRVYDWERPGLDGQLRPLHLPDALAVFDPTLGREACPVSHPLSGLDGEALLQTSKFRLERWRIDGREQLPVTELMTFVTLSGEGTVAGHGGHPQSLTKGASCVVPCGVSMVDFTGRDLDLAVCLPPV